MMKQTMADIWRFYRDGFRQMTWGRVLWLIIIVKLVVMFGVLRLFFFPDFLATMSADDDKDRYVSSELIERATLSEPDYP